MGVLSNQNSGRKKMNDEIDSVRNDGLDREGLLSRIKSLEQENDNLRKKLSASYAGGGSNNFPSRDEIDSISSMIDIINKIDDSTLRKIERLNKNG